jgi:hypothetical protein
MKTNLSNHNLNDNITSKILKYTNPSVYIQKSSLENDFLHKSKLTFKLDFKDFIETVASGYDLNSYRHMGSLHCSICEQSIHGSVMFCSLCGHGRHVKELTKWCLCNAECPTGVVVDVASKLSTGEESPIDRLL